MSAAMPTPTTDSLWHAIEDLWPAIISHPFLDELHAGTLPVQKFRYFLRQDYNYLEDFARVLALGAARAPGGSEMRTFLGHTQQVFSVEEALHGELTGELGGDRRALGKGPRGPATQSYVDFLMRHGFQGDFPRLVAAVLPCYWIYRQVGVALQEQGPSPHPAYEAWIATYAGEEYGTAVADMRAIADGVLAGTPGRLEELADIFRQGVLHEHGFWDQAYELGGQAGDPGAA